MQPRVYYFGLDAARFFAACLVMFFHLGFWSWAERGSTVDAFAGAARLETLGPYAWFGAIGVQIFFVISGFVIAESANGSTALTFLRSRILRLYPAAWICASATLVCLLVVANLPAGALFQPYLRSISLWPWGPWIDGSYWTLPIEICFYGLIFCVLVAQGFRQIQWVAWVLTIESAAFALCTYADIHLPANLPVIAFLQRNYVFFLFEHGCLFALGIWLWLATERRISCLGFAGLMLAATGCLFQISNSFGPAIRDYPQILSYWSGSVATPMIVWAASIALMFLSAYSVETTSPRSDTTLRFCRSFGLATYPLYLLHDNIGAHMMRLLIKAGTAPIAAMLFAIAALGAASFLVSGWLEPAVRNLLKPLLRRPAGPLGTGRKPVVAVSAFKSPRLP